LGLVGAWTGRFMRIHAVIRRLFGSWHKSSI
jgi:hypothetical protein